MTSVTDRHAHREELCKRPSALVLPRPPARGPFTGPGYLNLVLRPWGESQGGNRATYSTDVPSSLLPVTLHGTWLYRPSSTGAERKLRVINSHTKQRQSGDAPLQAAQVDSRCRHQAGPLRAYLRCFECWSVLRPPPPPPPPTPARSPPRPGPLSATLNPAHSAIRPHGPAPAPEVVAGGAEHAGTLTGPRGSSRHCVNSPVPHPDLPVTSPGSLCDVRSTQ